MARRLNDEGMRGAYVCVCGSIRPLRGPTADLFRTLIKAIGGVTPAICYECGEVMTEVAGTWVCEKKVMGGIWPFRKVKEMHWGFQQEKQVRRHGSTTENDSEMDK